VSRTGITNGRVRIDKVRVLIVDDSYDQRELLRRHFEIAGCDVICAESAEAAIYAYESGNLDLDLAVVDLLLPGMDGWALCGRLQIDRPDCQVVISSVLDQADYPESGAAAMPKPVSRANIRAVLSSCVPKWVAP
jgi:CheY-like chemotaxis protein